MFHLEDGFIAKPPPSHNDVPENCRYEDMDVGSENLPEYGNGREIKRKFDHQKKKKSDHLGKMPTDSPNTAMQVIF